MPEAGFQLILVPALPLAQRMAGKERGLPVKGAPTNLPSGHQWIPLHFRRVSQGEYFYKEEKKKDVPVLKTNKYKLRYLKRL